MKQKFLFLIVGIILITTVAYITFGNSLVSFTNVIFSNKKYDWGKKCIYHFSAMSNILTLDDDLDTSIILKEDADTNYMVSKQYLTPRPHPDRITYQDGFFYEPLTDIIKARIYGLSYKEDCTVPYDNLRYLNVLYYNFNGESTSGEIICNKSIAQDLVEIFYELYQNSYPIEKIHLIDDYNADDDISCAENNTSCFNYRVVGGTSTLSKHALGMAIDINPFYNPYVTYPNGVERISPPGSEPYANRNADLPYMIKKGDLCYNLFKEHGFTWGGEWKTLKDYQHFQKE